ncbi:hypothetical protein [Saccharothrix sp. NRRL B-16314]|uniref:hypothetical protein n=1 Tax=Saccharothrix sp. NRRL B-16314 TaxID=1463825 RepID=UPI0005273E2A|nr:hypothetical protein [Saccharothrix sp. NRRL B-16314]
MGTDATTPAGVRDDRQSTATRRMCAGVYLNREFRDLVIRDVHNDCRHRVAPSYGFDLVAVVEHARRAWALGTAYQLCLVALFAAGMSTNVMATVLAAFAILSLRSVTDVLSAFVVLLNLQGRSWGRKWRARVESDDDAQELREQKRRFWLDLGECVVLASVVVAVVELGPSSLAAALPQGMLTLLLAAAFAMATGVTQQFAVNRLHRTANLRPTRLCKRSEVVDAQQASTLVVYGHRYSSQSTPSPFVGSGFVHRWPPQSIQLVRAAAREPEFIASDHPRFDAPELIRYLRKAATELSGFQEGPGLSGLHVRDRLFVAEEHVAAVRNLLLNEPTADEVEQIIANPDSPVKHYLEIGVSRSGEVVTTIFVNLTLRARTLNIDFSLGMLTSLPEEFKVVDAYRRNGVGEVVRSAFRALHDLPREFGQSWHLGAAPWVAARAWYARKDRTLVSKRNSVIGARVSIRQELQRVRRERHFADDVQEIAENKNFILNPMFEGIIEFLKMKGMDVSAFERHMNTVINANVFSAGSLNIEGSSIGSGATVNQAGTNIPDSFSGGV